MDPIPAKRGQTRTQSSNVAVATGAQRQLNAQSASTSLLSYLQPAPQGTRFKKILKEQGSKKALKILVLDTRSRLSGCKVSKFMALGIRARAPEKRKKKEVVAWMMVFPAMKFGTMALQKLTYALASVSVKNTMRVL